MTTFGIWQRHGCVIRVLEFISNKNVIHSIFNLTFLYVPLCILIFYFKVFSVFNIKQNYNKSRDAFSRFRMNSMDTSLFQSPQWYHYTELLYFAFSFLVVFITYVCVSKNKLLSFGCFWNLNTSSSIGIIFEIAFSSFLCSWY
jgi:4-amino-4-deoxy-L-arabinose transferase-like glycosyltransferase